MIRSIDIVSVKLPNNIEGLLKEGVIGDTVDGLLRHLWELWHFLFYIHNEAPDGYRLPLGWTFLEVVFYDDWYWEVNVRKKEE